MPETVFTIGHSTHAQERFIALLSQHAITAVCDVRSQPYSRVNPQFNREDLKKSLKARGISYVFLGKELGARSEDPACYEKGKVQYDRLAETELFRKGIRRVQDGMKTFRIALMCAEKEPLDCHRTILVARHLNDLGIDVQHIHASGKLETHSDALQRLATMLKLPQADLFSPNQDMFAAAYRRQEERIAYDANAGATAMTAPVAESATG